MHYLFKTRYPKYNMSVAHLPIVFKNITLVDVLSASPLLKTGLRIDAHGFISDVSEKTIPQKGDTIIEAEGIYASMGWCDVGCLHGDPGFEYREDLNSLTEAAARGGFTALSPFPNTTPTIQTKTDILYLKAHARKSGVNIYPIGAVTTDINGRDFTEMMDMHEFGAVAFSDGTHSIKNSGVMMRALQYVKSFGGLIINTPLNADLAQGGSVHEGIMSVSLGLTGIPTLAETLALSRDIQLLEYADSRMHVFGISSEESVKIIQQAQEKKLNLTASTSVWHLNFTDAQVSGFDTHYKLMPPLRSETDKSALIAAVVDGTIQFLNSLHTPMDSDNKDTEFLEAEFGNISLQTAFALGYRALKDVLSLPDYVALWSTAPRKVLQIQAPKIAVGEKAEITFFSLETFIFNKEDIVSKSHNTPLIGESFDVKVIGTCNGSKLRIS